MYPLLYNNNPNKVFVKKLYSIPFDFRHYNNDLRKDIAIFWSFLLKELFISIYTYISNVLIARRVKSASKEKGYQAQFDGNLPNNLYK